MTSTTVRGTRRRRVVAGVVAGASLLTVGGLASSALFTDSASIDGNDFAFGTVDISTDPTTKVFSLPAALPGDVVTAPLTVANNGTMELRYAVSDVVTSATGATDADKVGNALVLTIKNADTGGGCTAFNGSEVYSGILGTSAGSKIIGDKAAGAQSGDRVLAAGAEDDLCVRVAVPSTVDNSFAGLKANTAFTFDAEQTRNNA